MQFWSNIQNRRKDEECFHINPFGRFIFGVKTKVKPHMNDQESNLSSSHIHVYVRHCELKTVRWFLVWLFHRVGVVLTKS